MHYKVISDSEVKVVAIDNIALVKDISIPIQVERDSVIYTVTEVDYSIFRYATSLVTLTLPDTIDEVQIQNSIYNLSDNYMMTALHITKETSSTSKWLSIDGIVYKYMDDANTTMNLVYFPKGKGGEYTLPDNVVKVENDVFDKVYKLEVFNMPVSYPGRFDFLDRRSSFILDDDYQFISALKEINIIGGNSITNDGVEIIIIDGILYGRNRNNGKLILLLFPMNWQGSEYTIPGDLESLRSSSSGLFYAPNLSKITNPENAILDDMSVYGGCIYTSTKDRLVFIPPKATTITIPNQVASLSDYKQFISQEKFNISVKEVIVEEGNPYLSSEDGIVFNKDKTTLHYYPEAKEGSTYKIKEGVTTIDEYAFLKNTTLQTIEIPNSVTTLKRACFAITNIEYVYIHGNTLSTIENEDVFANINEAGNLNLLGNIKALYYEDSAVLQSLIDTVGPEIESVAFDGTIATATMNDDVKAIKNEDNTVTITWSGDSDGYEIRRYNSKTRSTYTVAGTVEGTTTFTDKDVQEGENITYAVVPYNYSNSRSTFETDPFKDRKEYGEEKRAKKEVYIENNYTVTFIGKDGSILKEEVVKEKGSATPPKAPEIEGYTFDKWDKGYTNVNSDLVIQAIYKENQKPEEIPPSKEEENQIEDKVTEEVIETEDSKEDVVDTSDTTSMIELLGLMIISGVYILKRKRI